MALVVEIRDELGSIDDGSSANAHDAVRAVAPEYLKSFLDVRNGSVLLHAGEGRRVSLTLLQELLDMRHHGRLGQRVASHDEHLGLLCLSCRASRILCHHVLKHLP